MMILRQSTAVTVKVGPFLDSTDGVTAETALTIQKADVRLTKNGGNYAAASADQGTSDAGAPHDELGDYDVSLDTTDTNTVGRLKLSVQKSGALPVWQEFHVIEEAIYDAHFAASATGLLPANVTQLGGDAQSLTDLKDFADDGYDPSTNKVEGVKTADTTTTNTDMRGTDSASTHSAADVWSVATRVLTAGTNIALAKGTGVTGFTDLSAADVRSALGMASADLDTQLDAVASAIAALNNISTSDILTALGTSGSLDAQLAAIAGYIDTEITSIINAIAALNDLDAAGVRTAVGMASADLDTQLDALNALSTAIKAVTDNLPDSGALTSLAQASALTTVDGVVDAIKVVTDQLVAAQSEPAGIPAANETPIAKLAFLFMALRNRVDLDSGAKTFFGDGGAAQFKKVVTDDGTTYSEAETAAP